MRLFSIIFLLLSAFGLNSLHAATSLSKFSSETGWRANYLRKIGIIAPSTKKTVVNALTRSRAQSEIMFDQKVKQQLPPKATNLDNMLVLKDSQAKSVAIDSTNRFISNHEELYLRRPRVVTVDSAFLFAQAHCAKREANLTAFHKDSSADFMCQIGCAAGQTNWAELLNGSPTALATGFMEQIESEIGQVNWVDLLGILPNELDFCLQESYRFEVDGEPEISLFWLFCYGYNIFPSLKEAILVADNVVEEASALECLAQSLATYLTISDVAQFSSKKKIWLCQFIEELSTKIEQLISQGHAVKLAQEALEGFRPSAGIDEYKLCFSAEEECLFHLDS